MSERTPAEREARRTALILAASQAVVGSAAVVCISLGALAGQYLLDADKSLATAPVTGFNVGVAIGAIPAASLIRKLGQRNGFQLGTATTALGGLVATLALLQSSFWLFVAGLVVVGLGGAFVQQFRFAAADNAPPEFKARAISFVLAGGVFTAVIGPQIVIFTRDLLAPVLFAGAFASIVALAAVGAVLLSFLRVRGSLNSHTEQSDVPARGLWEIATQPQFAVGLLCARGLLRADELRHDRRAAGDGRLRLHAGPGRDRHIVARHGDVCAKLHHRRVDLGSARRPSSRQV